MNITRSCLTTYIKQKVKGIFNIKVNEVQLPPFRILNFKTYLLIYLPLYPLCLFLESFLLVEEGGKTTTFFILKSIDPRWTLRLDLLFREEKEDLKFKSLVQTSHDLVL